MAGNKAEEMIEFSVNRYGSVYELSEETREKLGQYFLSKAEPITFYETNIDYVGESDIYCSGTENWSCSGAAWIILSR